MQCSLAAIFQLCLYANNYTSLLTISFDFCAISYVIACRKSLNHGTLSISVETILFIPIVLNISEMLWSSLALHSTNKAFTLLAYSSPLDLGTWRGEKPRKRGWKDKRGGRERERWWMEEEKGRRKEEAKEKKTQTKERQKAGKNAMDWTLYKKHKNEQSQLRSLLYIKHKSTWPWAIF